MIDRQLQQIIDSWFIIDSSLLFVIEFGGKDIPYLLCVLDDSAKKESMPFEMKIGVRRDAKIMEWRLSTLYLCMLYEDAWWPIHWPSPDEIITTYYEGKVL